MKRGELAQRITHDIDAYLDLKKPGEQILSEPELVSAFQSMYRDEIRALGGPGSIVRWLSDVVRRVLIARKLAKPYEQMTDAEFAQLSEQYRACAGQHLEAAEKLGASMLTRRNQ